MSWGWIRRTFPSPSIRPVSPGPTHTHTHTRTYKVHIYTHTYKVRIHTHTHVQRPYTHTHTQSPYTHSHTHTHTHTHKYSLYTHSYTHGHMHTHARRHSHTQSPYTHSHTQIQSVYTIATHMRMHTHTHGILQTKGNQRVQEKTRAQHRMAAQKQADRHWVDVLLHKWPHSPWGRAENKALSQTWPRPRSAWLIATRGKPYAGQSGQTSHPERHNKLLHETRHNFLLHETRHN